MFLGRCVCAIRNQIKDVNLTRFTCILVFQDCFRNVRYWSNVKEMFQVKVFLYRTGNRSCLWPLSCIISQIIYEVSAVQSAGAVRNVKKSLGVYFSGVWWFWGLHSLQ